MALASNFEISAAAPVATDGAAAQGRQTYLYVP